jgi:hypothetical protein
MEKYGLNVPTGDAGGVERLPGLLFADDLVLLADNMKDLQRLMNMATAWADKWGMIFGINKCAILCFGGDRETVDQNEYVLQNHHVPVAESYTYLGMLFTDTLDLEKMCERQALAAKKAMWSLRPLLFSKQVPIHTKIMVIKACVVPVLLFGAELWGMCGRLVRKHQTLLNSAVRWSLASKSGKAAISIMSSSLEFGIPTVEALAAAARTRALKKYQHSNTVVQDLIAAPPKTHKLAWVTGGQRWLNGLIAEAPTLDLEDEDMGEGLVSGPLSPNKMKRVTANLYGEKAWAAFVKRQVSLRVLNRDSTEQTAWYRRYFESGKVSEWYWLTRCAPQWATGYALLASARVGAYASTVKWANMRLVSPEWKVKCPCCLQSSPETIAHILLECECWAHARKLFLAPLIDIVCSLVPAVSVSSVVVEARAALMLGGKVDEISVPEWEPKRIHGSKRRLLDSFVLGSEDCAKFIMKAEGEAVGEVFDFEHCFALKVARFLMSIEKTRMKRLGPLKDTQLAAIQGRRNKNSRPGRVLPKTVVRLL